MGVERNIEVHIENLVLHGFEAGPSGDIGRAVQGELTRLLGEKGIVPARPGSAPDASRRWIVRADTWCGAARSGRSHRPGRAWRADPMSEPTATRLPRQPKTDSATPRPFLAPRPSPRQHDPQTVPPIVHEVLHSPGQPLDPETHTLFESHFGHDFSKVRVHADAFASRVADCLRARAFTTGHHVVFAGHEYAPTTGTGRQLLQHELVGT